MYTPDSSYVGYQPIRVGWRDVLKGFGSVPSADNILASYDRWCKKFNIDPNLAIAQACQEATYFTSVRWRTEWNPAGLGITANNTPPNPFLSPDAGIRAHIEHICCYVYLSAACPTDHNNLSDRRHFFHDGLPAIKDLERLPDRGWANPGTNYVSAILAIANSIIGGTPVSTEPTEADIGFPVTINLVGTRGPARSLSDVEWFVVHDGEGGYQSVVNTLSNNLDASAHAVIAHNGSLTYMVPIEFTAWHPGNNAVAVASVGVEQEGFADAHDGGYTDDQYKSMAAFYRWCVARGCPIQATYIGRDDADGGPEPDDSGILGHQDVPDGSGGWGGFSHHTDPGPSYDWNKLISLVGNAPAPVPPPSDVEYFPQTGHNLGGGFKTYWHKNGGLAIFGYPVTNEVTEGSLTVQYFERAKFELHSDKVQLARLGSAAARAAGYSGPGI